MEFNVGDTIVKIGETRTYSVLRVTSEWYELFWNGFGLSQRFPRTMWKRSLFLLRPFKNQLMELTNRVIDI